MFLRKPTHTQQLVVAGLLITVMLTTIFTGCAESAVPVARTVATPSSSIPTLLITAVDYGYEMPNNINLRAGLLDLAMVNNGTQAHQTQVARLNKGVTRAKVYDELVSKRNQAAVFSLLTLVGGPDTVSPGYGQEAILNLPAGEYVLLCLVVGDDGVAHVSKGMIHFFTVGNAVAEGQTNSPRTDGVIGMKDNGYVLPSVIAQERALTLQVVNQGSEPHEMNIVKLSKGKSAQDIVKFFQAPSGPPPFEELGGMAALASGASGWIKVQLDPGNYAVFSFVPDLRTGRSQLDEGMITQFTA